MRRVHKQNQRRKFTRRYQEAHPVVYEEPDWTNDWDEIASGPVDIAKSA